MALTGKLYHPEIPIIKTYKQNAAAFITIILSLFTINNTNAQTGPPALPPVQLNRWILAEPNWLDIFGDAPLDFTNLNTVPSWSEAGTSLSVDTNCPAFLDLPAVDGDNANISLAAGTLTFWYQPNWTSVPDGGNGLTNWANLLSLGEWTSNASASCWSLFIDPGGTNLVFLTQSNGTSQIVLTAPIDFDAGDWHDVSLTYSSTNCCLYLEGELVTNASPISTMVSGSDLADYGIFVGSEGTNGVFQARGQFQDLKIYDGPLSAADILADYNNISAIITDWGGSVGLSGGHSWVDSIPSLPGSGGTNGGMTILSLTNNYSVTTNYNTYSNFWLDIDLSTNGTEAFVSLDSTLPGLTYNILTNSDLDTNNWGVSCTLLASNDFTSAAPMSVGTNSMYFQGNLVWSTGTNSLPDWWQLEYFGALDVSSNGDYDGDGFDNYYEYQHGIDPNKIQFGLRFTNAFVATNVVSGGVYLAAGVPSFSAGLMNSTNFASATWQSWSSNVTATLGTTNGIYNVWIGLRGLPTNAHQTWMQTRLTLYNAPLVLSVSNGAGGVVTQSVLQLQGYSPVQMSSLTFNLSNAVSVVTNQPVAITGRFYNTNLLEYTSNYFQTSFSLAPGSNFITLQAADYSGRTTSTNFAVNYVPSTNPPTLTLISNSHFD